MWAGGQLEFLDTLVVGDAVTRSSKILDVTLKTGSTGALCFVSVEHLITTPRGLAIRERQDIVYRDAPTSMAPPAPAPKEVPAALHRETHFADPVLLFRYSALTFNAHRIHYDRRYGTDVEAYPGLVVHGPLMATMLVDLVRRNSGRRLGEFRFRALSPVFDTGGFALCGREENDGAALWVQRDDGTLAMEATATFAAS
jgi:3-methylfumaryl-CoA hydratase